MRSPGSPGPPRETESPLRDEEGFADVFRAIETQGPGETG